LLGSGIASYSCPQACRARGWSSQKEEGPGGASLSPWPVQFLPRYDPSGQAPARAQRLGHWNWSGPRPPPISQEQPSEAMSPALAGSHPCRRCGERGPCQVKSDLRSGSKADRYGRAWPDFTILYPTAASSPSNTRHVLDATPLVEEVQQQSEIQLQVRHMGIQLIAIELAYRTANSVSGRISKITSSIMGCSPSSHGAEPSPGRATRQAWWPPQGGRAA
jgi:hypothetical protein